MGRDYGAPCGRPYGKSLDPTQPADPPLKPPMLAEPIPDVRADPWPTNRCLAWGTGLARVLKEGSYPRHRTGREIEALNDGENKRGCDAEHYHSGHRFKSGPKQLPSRRQYDVLEGGTANDILLLFWLTKEPNAEKSTRSTRKPMPVILTTQGEINAWLTARTATQP